MPAPTTRESIPDKLYRLHQELAEKRGEAACGCSSCGLHRTLQGTTPGRPWKVRARRGVESTEEI